MDRTIYFNGKKFWVAHNLHHALAHLRHETESKVLWVDALCINQIDIKEREAQVQHMCNIYGSATRVVVWLNASPFGIRQAFQAARRHNPSTRYHFGTVCVVSKLPSSPWWMRVWVVQELIAAKQVIIQCSRDTIEWDRFCGLVDSAIQSHSFDPAGTYLQEYRALKKYGLSKTISASGNNLLELLFAFHMKQATDPRDKIFAFLALSRGGEEDTAIRADYTSESVDVFQDCAVKLINASKSLSVLVLNECIGTSFLSRGIAREFTWCPRWSGSGNNFRATPFWTGPYSYNQPWATASRFSAAGGIDAPSCVVVEEMMRLSGWAADEVVAIGQTTQVTWLKFFSMVKHGAETPHVAAAVDVWRYWGNVLPQWKELAETSSRVPRDTLTTRQAFYTAITAGVYRDGPSSDIVNEEIMPAVKAASYGRTFFVTASGLLGLGPDYFARPKIYRRLSRKLQSQLQANL
ncbi:heterokaryon incompatibility protein-domain-containing protein [Hypoxylon sp. FL1284]|nr:heterokaryon incompatibility protein-domain-containing protein [Hypoxylon sp. FL1284]